MKKAALLTVFTFLLILIACQPKAAAPNPAFNPNSFLTASDVPPITPIPSATLVGQTATITALLDLGNGGAGFASTIYAQEVNTGRTFHGFQSAGMHGQAVLPTSPPISFMVSAPGTYVFYARLINAPDDYFYGATNCPTLATPCPEHALIAIKVQPNQTYLVIINDPKVNLPALGQPVTVPWVPGP